MNILKNCLFTLSILLTASLSSFTAYAAEVEENPEDQTAAPYFLIESADPETDRFPLKDTQVNTTISGIIAETYVTQTYTNEGINPISASYIFPASTKVTVHGMTMTIGDQVITSQIKEKEEAKETFEEAKSEGKSASLLEEERPNVFSMNVANIMPGDTIVIELHYTEQILSTENIYQFVFPTVIGPRYVSPLYGAETDEVVNAEMYDQAVGDTADENWAAIPYIPEGNATPGTYNINVNLSAGVPISDLQCISHNTDVAWRDVTNAQITLSDSEDFAGNRDYILEYQLTGEEISSGLMLDTGETENFFMLSIQPPERYEPEDIPPREYIFVVDVSGSMSGFPLKTSTELFSNLVSNLRKNDSFNLILFSGASTRLSDISLPANETNIQSAINMLNREDGSGGTELALALEDAVDILRRNNTARSIIVITDGYVWGEEEVFQIVHENLSTTNFFSFGIGSAVNRYLIEGIAKAGQGESFVATEPIEANDVAERFRTYVEAPIMTNIKVEFDGFEVYDTEPQNLPTLFAQRPIILYGKWRGEPTGTIRITGKTGNQDYYQEISVAEISQETDSALRYLWARNRIDRITDYGINQYKPEIQAEVTAIGLQYSILTPYTSFVAVLDTVRNPEGESNDVDQPNPLPLHVSNLAVGYTVGSEPGDLILIACALLLALTAYLRASYRAKKINPKK